jgi:hypothetical protein
LAPTCTSDSDAAAKSLKALQGSLAQSVLGWHAGGSMKAPSLLASIALAVMACANHRTQSPTTPYADDLVSVEDDTVGPAVTACRDDGFCENNLRCGPDGMCHRGGLCGSGNALRREDAYRGTCSDDRTEAQWCAWDEARLRHVIVKWKCRDSSAFAANSVCQTTKCKDGEGKAVAGVYCCPQPQQ